MKILATRLAFYTSTLTIIPVETAIPRPQYVLGTMSPKPTLRNVMAISHMALRRFACSSSWNLWQNDKPTTVYFSKKNVTMDAIFLYRSSRLSPFCVYIIPLSTLLFPFFFLFLFSLFLFFLLRSWIFTRCSIHCARHSASWLQREHRELLLLNLNAEGDYEIPAERTHAIAPLSTWAVLINTTMFDSRYCDTRYLALLNWNFFLPSFLMFQQCRCLLY